MLVELVDRWLGSQPKCRRKKKEGVVKNELGIEKSSGSLSVPFFGFFCSEN